MPDDKISGSGGQTRQTVERRIAYRVLTNDPFLLAGTPNPVEASDGRCRVAGRPGLEWGLWRVAKMEGIGGIAHDGKPAEPRSR